MNYIRTGYLKIELNDSGPRDAPAVLLLHGWPDDASTWDLIALRLNAAGFRTIAPMHRGFGGTRFLLENTPRTGNTGILALDQIDLMDTLNIDHFYVAGHDWGAGVAETLAVGWPDRVVKLAMCSTLSRLGGLSTPSFQQARRYWYHWFQATERGAQAVANDPQGFARMMWETWSPAGWFDEKTFTAVAQSFLNPDWVAVTLHSYRSRWGAAPFDPRSVELEDKVKSTKSISTPTLFFQGEVDGVTPPEASESMASKFSGSFERIILKGVGHFPLREKPEAVAEKLIQHFTATGH